VNCRQQAAIERPDDFGSGSNLRNLDAGNHAAQSVQLLDPGNHGAQTVRNLDAGNQAPQFTIHNSQILLALFLLVLRLELCDDVGIGEGRRIAERLTFRDVPEQPPHDLS
jgi:hypothetical protein